MKNKNLIKIFVCLGVVFILLGYNFTFAQADTSSSTSFFLDMLNILMRAFSWSWVIIALIAGKLMSNSFIYGAFMHMDIYLWKLWNISKNLSNYVLGFMFLFFIIKSFFTKETASDVVKRIGSFVICAILINTSWFIIGAMVDIANVATLGIGGLPMQFMNSAIGSSTSNNLQSLCTKIPEQITVKISDVNDTSNLFQSTTTGGKELCMDALLPKDGSVAGPFLFFGYSVFKFQSFDMAPSGGNISIKDLTLSTVLKSIIMLMFLAPLVALLLANVIRIFVIWIWVIFGPIFFLAKFFDPIKKSLDQTGSNFLKNIMSFEALIGLVFQPMIVVAVMSLGMIFTLGLVDVFKGGGPSSAAVNNVINFDGNKVSGDKDKSTIEMAAGGKTTVEGSLFKDSADIAGGTVGYVILTLFSIVILWMLLKVGFDFSKVTKSVSDFVFNSAQGLAMQAKLPGGYSAGALKQAYDTNISTQGAHNFLDLEKKLGDQSKYVQNKLANTAFGKAFRMKEGETSDLDASNIADLEKKFYNAKAEVSTEHKAFLDSLYGTLEDKKIRLGSSKIVPLIEKWLNTGKGADFLLNQAASGSSSYLIGEIEAIKKNGYKIDKLISEPSYFNAFLNGVLTGNINYAVQEKYKAIKDETFGGAK